MNITRTASTLTAVAAIAACAAPAHAASHGTLRFFSKQTSERIIDQSGNPISGDPAVGDIFIGTDDDYVGNHKKHAKKAVGSDHILCTLTELDVANGKLIGVCDGQFALPGGMVLSDHQTVNLAEDATFEITGGTGKYARVKSGTIVSHSTSNGTDSDVTIKF